MLGFEHIGDLGVGATGPKFVISTFMGPNPYNVTNFFHGWIRKRSVPNDWESLSGEVQSIYCKNVLHTIH